MVDCDTAKVAHVHPLGWGFSADQGGGGGGNRPQPVDGLAAGDSVQLTVDLSLDFGGGYTRLTTRRPTR